MLKILPTSNLNQPIKTKCGEVFYDSCTDFTIDCCFCEIKLFAFEDFHIHIQNIHFENNLLKLETKTNDCNESLKHKFEDDTSKVVYKKEEESFESLDISCDYNEAEHNCGNIEDYSFEEDDASKVELYIKEEEELEILDISCDYNDDEHICDNIEDEDSKVDEEEPFENLDVSSDYNDDEYSCANTENKELLKVKNVKKRRVSKKSKNNTANKSDAEEFQTEGVSVIFFIFYEIFCLYSKKVTFMITLLK